MRSVVIKFKDHGCLKFPPSSLSKYGEKTLITSFNGANAVFIIRPYSSSTRLAEVGKFESKKTDENCYSAGQTFLHRIFGYRGVTLFPWIARVHDIDIRKQHSELGDSEVGGRSTNVSSISGSESHSKKHHLNGDFAKGHKHDSSLGSNKKENSSNNSNGSADPLTFHQSKMTIHSATQFHPYYQVLIDTRDCPFVSNRTQTEVVTFLGHPDSSKDVHPIKGLDYVAHEDMLPYTSHEERPIHHELYSRLFKCQNPSNSPSSSSAAASIRTSITAQRQSKKLSSSPTNSSTPTTPTTNKFFPTESLESWRDQHPWLELSRVYRETTENVRVTVIPFYLGHTLINNTSFHWWRYCVRLENFSDVSVQLRERHWKLFSQKNMLQTIKGRGVVGVEPVLSKSEPAYQYSSHINLQDKSGHMWGTFKMQREDGHTFECRIPPFSLESAIESTTPPTSKRSN